MPWHFFVLCAETQRVFSHCWGWCAARRLIQYPWSHGDCLYGNSLRLLALCTLFSQSLHADRFLYCVSFQNIRAKMSIRAEDRPKAFEAKFLKESGQIAKYGEFNFQPGKIVCAKKDINNYFTNKCICVIDYYFCWQQLGFSECKWYNTALPILL